MAIVNSIATYAGNSFEYASNIGVVILTAAPQTVRVPAAGSISPAVTRGLWRMKIYNQTVAISFGSAILQAGDGTNLAQVDDYVPVAALAITATAWIDVCGDFIFDTSVAGGGATGTLLNFGATFFNFLVTTTGAGGTASGDFEIAAAP